ncbi:MAG: CcmD family protein [Cyclobacteriaceae bacterium]
MKKLLHYTSILLTLLLTSITGLLAQVTTESTQHVEMADTFRSEGKIYVVVLVAVVLFSGFTLFMVLTERKIARLEKTFKDLKGNADK